MLLGLLWGAAATAHAQAKPADEYKKAIEGAVYEFDAGNWPEARVLFEQAHALRPSARTLRGMGKVSFELKEYVRAQKELNASLVELRSPLSEAQRHEVLGLLLRVEKFIGKLVVHVKPSDAAASIILDGSNVEGELKLDLGQHELSVQAPGYRSLTRTVSIEGGKTQRLELTLTPVDVTRGISQPVAAEQNLFETPATPQPSDQARSGVLQQWWFWTIVGAVVVGGAATAIALTAQSHPEPEVAGNTGLKIEVLILAR
ncbi:MAG TPA: PEGA domain-containing protein [Polyangiales bacterium]|nr:PEGA domain-containing protein [Polyangiales bacterium]